MLKHDAKFCFYLNSDVLRIHLQRVPEMYVYALAKYVSKLVLNLYSALRNASNALTLCLNLQCEIQILLSGSSIF